MTFSRILFASGLAFGFLNCPVAIAAIDPATLSYLESKLEQSKTEDPEVAKLLSESLQRSGQANVAGFLKLVDWCAESRDHAGLTESKTNQAFYYFNRELEEPEGLKTKELEQYYGPKIQKTLPRDERFEHLQWIFQDDFYVLTKMENQRRICLRTGLSQDLLMEFLVHEMVHYARVPSDMTTFESRLESDPLSYGRRVLLQPGDEADAYIFQYSFVIRHFQKVRLQAPPGVERLFSDDGQFVGRREDLALPILEDLGYYKHRFQDEYERVLSRQLQTRIQELDFARKLFKARQDESAHWTQESRSRSTFLNFFWPSYRSESRHLELLILKNQSSQTRLQSMILKDLKECREIKTHSRAHPDAILSCEEKASSSL